jgi:hypothetical protein
MPEAKKELGIPGLLPGFPFVRELAATLTCGVRDACLSGKEK